MFEFHGWATICVDDHDDPVLDIKEQREAIAMTRIREALREAHDDFSLYELKRLGNGLIVLMAHGLRNHRQDAPIDLFRWLAAELPDSYGLLYIRDDEDSSRLATDHSNDFRVWRLAQGQFEEFDDALLSPCIPTIERPFVFPEE